MSLLVPQQFLNEFQFSSLVVVKILQTNWDGNELWMNDGRVLGKPLDQQWVLSQHLLGLDCLWHGFIRVVCHENEFCCGVGNDDIDKAANEIRFHKDDVAIFG